MNNLPHLARIESLPSGGWQVVLRDRTSDVRFIGCDGQGFTREEAEALLCKLDAFLAERN